MNETPREPRPPDEGDLNRPDEPDGLHRQEDHDDDYDDQAEDQPSRRRFLSGSRLAAVAGVVVIVAGAGIALALTGGGGRGGEGSDGSSSDEPTSLEDAALRFTECMRDEGIDMPDPQVTDDGMRVSGGPDPENLSPRQQEAKEACQRFLDQMDRQEGEDLSPEEIAERQDQALAMSECMRDRGWDIPDPEVREDGSISIAVDIEGDDRIIPAPEDPDFDQFKQDQQACHEESGLPGPRGGAGASGGRDGDVPGGAGS